MEAGKHSIKQLFQKDVRYVIPTFQRPYVWKQEQQWEPFWNDIRNIAEDYADALAESDNNQAEAERKTSTHFLGAIVLQQMPTPSIEVDRRDVIDGQQRMTTLQLLLDAAQEVIEQEGFDKDAKRLRKLVLNDEDFSEGDTQFKLWPTSGDQDSFRVAMTNGQSTQGFENSLIVQAHEFFSLQIREWLHAVEGDERAQRSQVLATTLIGLLELVVIDLKTGDDAYVIFETLNARGTPLLASDLVKNFVLQTANAKAYSPDKLYADYWRPFEEEWWRKEISQGRIFRPRIDIFLNYWLVARQQKEVPSHKVFPAFRDYAEAKNVDILDIVRDIQHAGSTYRRLEEFDSKSVEGTFIYRWNIVEAGVVTPLLLQLFSAEESQVSQDRRTRCLQALESFLVRRMICRMTTKDYNRLVLELISRLEGHIDRADEIIVAYLGEQTSESRLWPDDERLQRDIPDLPLYRLLTRTRLRMVMEAIEESLRTNKTEDRYVARGCLTIEHILPQEWRDHWPLEITDDPEEHHRRIQRRERLKHTLGNLTLVTNALNPALSNGPWKQKQKGLQEHSTLHLNKRLLQEWGNKPFAEPQIEERGKQLAQLVCAVWPKYK
ncbi:MAG: DUF262 domain-containing protein [Anaerolineae bacterium]|nr:DUF262 domain-containing protein [Anaerolineae bacterium]